LPPTSAPVSCFATMSLHLSKQQGDLVLEAHVAYVCFKCFRYFRVVLQVFYIDVAKVDRDVPHVAMAIHTYFKCVDSKYFIYFRRISCKCLIWMLHIYM
jgi:hypothetical protein